MIVTHLLSTPQLWVARLSLGFGPPQNGGFHFGIPSKPPEKGYQLKRQTHICIVVGGVHDQWHSPLQAADQGRLQKSTCICLPRPAQGHDHASADPHVESGHQLPFWRGQLLRAFEGFRITDPKSRTVWRRP